MLGVLVLAVSQLALVVLCSMGISKIANRFDVSIPLPVSIILVFSSLHLFPVVFFLIFGFPMHWIVSVSLVVTAIVGLSNIEKENFSSLPHHFSRSKWSCIALLVVIAIRIATIPQDTSLVRGDIVSHIAPIIEWEEGKLGYPGVSYPRGFHGIFLSLSFGLDYSLVSNSLFIFLMATGWILFTAIVRGHLEDVESSCVVLLAGGGGVIGIPDGIIENTGWWLVRQSNLQPEVSAWVFVLAIMWVIDNREISEGLSPQVKSTLIGLLILGASTTNPFFFMVCSPFVFCWSLLTYTFSYNELLPRGGFQYILLFSPIIVLICSAILMGVTEWRFAGTSADIHDSTHRHNLLIEEMGVYYTDGLTVNTILVMLTPKPELTIGEVSIGKMVKLVLLPAWFIIMAALFSGFNRTKTGIFSIAVVVLYLLWYLGIPAPDGWSVIRTQYPHRAFAMLLLVYLLKDMANSNNIVILAGSLLWLSIEPETSYDLIFRYEHSTRAIIACIAFLIFLKAQDFFPEFSLDFDSLRFWAPIFIPMILFGFWSSFNLAKLPNPDLGVLFFGSTILLLIGIAVRRPDSFASFLSISSVSLCSGALFGHLYDLSLGNYHKSSFILVSFLFSFFIFHALQINKLSEFLRKNSMKLLMLIIIINGGCQLFDPDYVTPLMIPGFPEDA